MQEDESKIKWSQFLAGDNEAYCWIYKVYIQMLFRYGHNFTSDTELIKDCIQDVFTGLYKNRERLIVPNNIKVYLFVAIKTASNELFIKNQSMKEVQWNKFHFYSNQLLKTNSSIMNNTIINKKKLKKSFLF